MAPAAHADGVPAVVAINATVEINAVRRERDIERLLHWCGCFVREYGKACTEALLQVTPRRNRAARLTPNPDSLKSLVASPLKPPGFTARHVRWPCDRRGGPEGSVSQPNPSDLTLLLA